MKLLCPCCSGLAYSDCCQPLHDGALPPNALALMRSRYTAYAYHKPDYIIRTTHPRNLLYREDHKAWTEEILLFCQRTQFQRLDIVDFIDGKKEAYVTFIAHLNEGPINTTLMEASYFIPVHKQWLYRRGTVIPI